MDAAIGLLLLTAVAVPGLSPPAGKQPVYLYLLASLEDARPGQSGTEWIDRLVEAIGRARGADLAARPSLTGLWAGQAVAPWSGTWRQAAQEGWFLPGYRAGEAAAGGLPWPEAARTVRPSSLIGRFPDEAGSLAVVASPGGLDDVAGLYALEHQTGCRHRIAFLPDEATGPVDVFHASALDKIRQRLSPAPDTSPDVFWFMGQLVLAADPDPEKAWVLAPDVPLDDLRDRLGRVDRTRPAVRLIWCGRPGAGFAPASGQPAEAVRPALEYLLRQFLPTNPGSGFVDGRSLMELVEPADGWTLPRADLVELARALLADWQAGPPDFLAVGRRYLTLAETYDLLTRAVHEAVQTGRLPDELGVRRVYGPMEVPARTAAAAARPLAREACRQAIAAGRVPAPPDAADPLAPPANRVPDKVKLEGQPDLEGVLVLWAAAREVAALAAGEKTTGYELPESRWLPPLARSWVLAHPGLGRAGPAPGLGQVWTLKPARFREAAAPARTESAALAAPAVAPIYVTFDFGWGGTFLHGGAVQVVEQIVQACERHGLRVHLQLTGELALALARDKPDVVARIRRLKLPIGYGGTFWPAPRPEDDFAQRRETPRDQLTTEQWQETLRQVWHLERGGVKAMRRLEAAPLEVGGWLAVAQVFDVIPLPTGQYGRGEMTTPTEWVLTALGAGSYRYENPWPADALPLPDMEHAHLFPERGSIPPTAAGCRPGRGSLRTADPVQWLHTLVDVLPRRHPYRLVISGRHWIEFRTLARVLEFMRSRPADFQIVAPDAEADQYAPANSARAFFRRQYGLEQVADALHLGLPEDLPARGTKASAGPGLRGELADVPLDSECSTRLRLALFSRAQVRELADRLLEHWPQADPSGHFGSPPPWLWAGDVPVCLADAFDALVQSVAAAAEDGRKLPEQVVGRGLRGPIDAPMFKYELPLRWRKQPRDRFRVLPRHVMALNHDDWQRLVRTTWEQGLPACGQGPELREPAHVLASLEAVVQAARNVNGRVSRHVPGRISLDLPCHDQAVPLPEWVGRERFPFTRWGATLNPGEFLYALAQAFRVIDRGLALRQVALVGCNIASGQYAAFMQAVTGGQRAMVIYREFLQPNELDLLWTRTPVP